MVTVGVVSGVTPTGEAVGLNVDEEMEFVFESVGKKPIVEAVEFNAPAHEDEWVGHVGGHDVWKVVGVDLIKGEVEDNKFVGTGVILDLGSRARR